jgi:Na+-transporting NADH:ubiquinone oxidoreductase subunit A
LQLGSKYFSYVDNNNLKKKIQELLVVMFFLENKLEEDGFLGYYDNQITVIPEGDDYEFLDGTNLFLIKFLPSRALTFSWLTPNKKYDLNTNTNGEHRAFVVTGSYEEVFPLDIYPMQFLKACMYQDLDEMEALGMYEVAPEDFALTEFVCVSKQPHQKIIREGLDLMLKKN